jgi:hypothetical protein
MLCFDGDKIIYHFPHIHNGMGPLKRNFVRNTLLCYNAQLYLFLFNAN